MQVPQSSPTVHAPQPAARFDFYASIHKAIRAMMFDALTGLGRMDPDDDADRAEHLDRVRALLTFCLKHIEHENVFVHPAIEARRPGVSYRVADDHDGHLEAIAQLELSVHAVERAPAAERRAAALHLYRALALFVAENFEHMHIEETEHNAALWSAYTDAEIIALHDRLVASIPPAESATVARWMLPFVDHAERVAIVEDMRAAAPAPVVAGVLDMLRAQLTPRDWNKLVGAMQLNDAAARKAA